jgi:hypothetical protein
MHHRIYEDDDGNVVQEFDAEAIEYFIEGLEALRDCEPGEQLTTPSVAVDDKFIPDSVGVFILERAEDK